MILTRIKQRLFPFYINLCNTILYGKNAPRAGSIIYIDPRQIDFYINKFPSGFSGLVLDGEWDKEHLKKINDHPKYKACEERWGRQQTWKSTGIYDFLLNEIERRNAPVDGCVNIEDIKIRYKNLDVIYENIKANKKLLSPEELGVGKNTKNKAVLVHIGRNNNLIFGASGFHRFSIAKILKLEVTPAQIGVIHPKAIKYWQVHERKSKPKMV